MRCPRGVEPVLGLAGRWEAAGVPPGCRERCHRRLVMLEGASQGHRLALSSMSSCAGRSLSSRMFTPPILTKCPLCAPIVCTDCVHQSRGSEGAETTWKCRPRTDCPRSNCLLPAGATPHLYNGNQGSETCRSGCSVPGT